MEEKTIDLAINKQYLAGKWTYLEAIREIVQNCVDEGAYGINVKTQSGSIEFVTFNGVIGIDKMALGTSTKANTPELIGKYGEGLKLGMVALLRDGLQIEIHNGEELWTPLIAHSDVFGCDTLQLRISPDNTSGKHPGGVTIAVSGLDAKQMTSLAETGLEMTKAIFGTAPEETSETSYGTIIRDESYKGQIFVGGLYVQTDDNLDYGFDFKPAYVALDRDRSVINYYQLMALVAKAIIDEGNPDAIFSGYRSNNLSDDISANLSEASDEAKTGFFEKYLASKKSHDPDMKEALTIAGTILVDEMVGEYLKTHAEVMRYEAAVEEDESLRDVFNEFSDSDGGKAKTIQALAEKAESWAQIKNSGAEMLRYFNESGYKEMLSAINHLRKARTPKWIVCFLRSKALPSFPKHSFQAILPFIDEAKVGNADYQLDFDKLQKEGKR